MWAQTGKAIFDGINTGLKTGKAIFDGIQMDLPFCGFFVSKLLGKHNYLDQLPSLDPGMIQQPITTPVSRSMSLANFN